MQITSGSETTQETIQETTQETISNKPISENDTKEESVDRDYEFSDYMAILYDDAEEMSSDEGYTPEITLPEYGNISN